MLSDLHASDEDDRGAIFAQLKARLVERRLATPGRAACIVDEAVAVTEDELGARTPGDLGRRGCYAATRSRGAEWRHVAGRGSGHRHSARRSLREHPVGACPGERVIAGNVHQVAQERVAGLGRGAHEGQDGVLGGATRHELAIADSQGAEQEQPLVGLG